MEWNFWYYPDTRPYRELALRFNCCICTPAAVTDAALGILYLLHPMREDETSWASGPGALAAQLAHLTLPLIVVMPYGYVAGNPRQAGTSTQRPIPSANEFREYFASIQTAVENHFRIDSSRRAIAGISMGGKQALEVALGNYGRFPVLGILSATLQRSRMARRGTFLNDVIDVCPVLQAGQPRVSKSLEMLFHYCGMQETAQDGTSDFLEGNRMLSRLLLERGVRQCYGSDLVAPAGRHRWDYWNPQQEAFLQTLSAHWRR